MVNVNSLFILTGVIGFKITVNWLSGYNFNGWLKKTGELVKDACHQRQHTPIYRKMPEPDRWFCFSKSAFQEAVVKDGYFL